MSQVDTLEEATERIRSSIEDALKGPTLVEARAWATEIDVRGGRRSSEAAIAAHREAQAKYRQAQSDETDAQEALDRALSEAEWMLGDSFITEGNKTFLVIKRGVGSSLVDDKGEVVKRQMTADEKRAWIANEARKEPAAIEAAAGLRVAKAATLAARDDLTHADLRVAAAKHDLDSRTAELYLLGAALPRKVTL